MQGKVDDAQGLSPGNDHQQESGDLTVTEEDVMQHMQKCLMNDLFPQLLHIENHPYEEKQNAKLLLDAITTTQTNTMTIIAGTSLNTDKEVKNGVELSICRAAFNWALFTQQSSMSLTLGEKIIKEFGAPQLIESIKDASAGEAISGGEAKTNHSAVEQGYYSTNLVALVNKYPDELQNFEITLSPGLQITRHLETFKNAGISFANNAPAPLYNTLAH